MPDMKEIIFATQNSHKVEEIRAALNDDLSIVTLGEAGLFIEIPEPFDTLEQNAMEKARVIHQLTGKNCFGEDTGLEVDALQGEPGVKSARYAGEERDFKKNTEKLLYKLRDEENRRAKFRTVIALILDNESHYFEGVCEGNILEAPHGDMGFGYDPVFQPTGASKSFAEMTTHEKNKYSHRRKAMDQLVNFLREKQGLRQS
jgi:XTP/dITP diphosphohydrolase